jgi:methylenetetrahydrofolate dehydrogenase (NADP+)/methenyltetrahydrofolate cyclohydrolase
MVARILEGNKIADDIKAEVVEEVKELRSKGINPCLKVILVGNDPASQIYVTNKERTSKDLGMDSETIRLDKSIPQNELLGLIDKLNQDSSVHGILVQLPLPDHMNQQTVIEAVNPGKDVDGFHPMNIGRLLIGQECFVPCTPAGIMEIIKRNDIPLKGKRAVIIGRSIIVGKPVALLLMAEHATITICHSRTVDLPGVASEADILVAAIGRPAMVTDEFVKPGAVVIDVGVNRVEKLEEVKDYFGDNEKKLAAFEKRGSVLVGDVHPRKVYPVAGAITPVPGGVGPLTIAMLMKSTVKAARKTL